MNRFLGYQIYLIPKILNCCKGCKKNIIYLYGTSWEKKSFRKVSFAHVCTSIFDQLCLLNKVNMLFLVANDDLWNLLWSLFCCLFCHHCFS
jgi:hypothetical protein